MVNGDDDTTRATPAPPPDRPLREWPLDQLGEQASLHADDAGALAALALEARHRRGARAKALEARLARMIAACPAARPAEHDQAARLRQTLAAAGREIAALRARLAALQASGACMAASEAEGPWRRLHLTSDAPAWLLAEVRRAYRRRYHPDREADQAHRRRSEEVFKRVEADFAEIDRRRGG